MEIQKAKLKDIPMIESILFEAADWMDTHNLHMWEKEKLVWSHLSKIYKLENFYLGFDQGKPVSCMALVDYDPIIWPDVKSGESLFIHKLAVSRSAAGKGYSQKMIAYAKTQCKTRSVPALRLDCHQYRAKLRALYEKEGFVCCGETLLFGVYPTAFYVLQIE